MSTIVVGVDGSPGSLEALRFAIEEARIANATVKAVAAWHVPPAAYGVDGPFRSMTKSFRLAAEAKLAKALEEVGAANCGVTVTPELVRGQPADVLCESAESAALLVVGSRGLGGFRGLLLGSVSQQCAHHAPCPVVITPPKARAPGPRGAVTQCVPESVLGASVAASPSLTSGSESVYAQDWPTCPRA